MKACDFLRKTLSDYWSWFRPERLEVPDCVLRLLETMYPTVNWNNVYFYEKLPWFIPQSSMTVAITLPGTYDFNKIHIYLAKKFDPCSCSGDDDEDTLGLDTIVHEAFHVLQFTDIGIGGVGFIRLFMMEYFGCWIKNGYKNSPMEEDAYAHEDQFRNCCSKLSKPICNCSTNPPTFNEEALKLLFSNCPDLIKKTSNFKYRCGIAQGVIGGLLNILIGGVLPIVESVFIVGWLSLATITFFICGLIKLWQIIVGFFQLVCKWVVHWEKKCTQWEQKRKQICGEYRDNGYNSCKEYKDNGYNSCKEWRENQTKKCCTWKPCSWFCKAWAWIVSTVCIAWIWISSWVCVVWIWVSSWICIAWVTIVSWICKSFTWVIKKITCW